MAKSNMTYCMTCKGTERLHVHHHYTLADGTKRTSYTCAPCAADRMRKYATTYKGREVINRLARETYQRHKKEAYARANLQWNIKSGKVVKPERCELCLIPGKLEGHHWHGYSKPLDVLFVHRACHAIVETR